MFHRIWASKAKIAVGSVLVLGLWACEGREQPAPPSAETGASAAEIAPAPQGPAVGSIEWALAGDWRVAPERDAWRHPAETLAFFGVKPDQTVVEIWPGGGWYTAVLGPYLRVGGGKLYAATYDPSASEYAARTLKVYKETFVDHPEVYGDIELSRADKSPDADLAPDGTVDVVLTFRNVHNWMKQDYADKIFADAFRALKPGGVLGVVEHRLPSAAEQDPKALSGYVQEALVIQLAREAGFEFDGSSEINANPKDDADHPFGVWTLPPVSRTEPREGGAPAPADFNPADYQAIGESDRMTLRFVKPAEEATSEP